MKNEVKKEESNAVSTIQETQKLCQMLMQTPHYKKMGAEGIFAIVQKAKSVGVDPLDALNGGFYYVQGKVEMTSTLMNDLIRRHGHSISKDKKSDATICILHGKRKDNNDTWSESFSIDDAQQAGIYRNQWLKYPKDMLFARALSRLARQLFPDVIKGCYVDGEIAQAVGTDQSVSAPIEVENEGLSQEQKETLMTSLSSLPDVEAAVEFFRRKYNTYDLSTVSVSDYESMIAIINKKLELVEEDSNESTTVA